MKTAILCCFIAALIFASVQFCSAQRRRNTNINWRGINYRSNNGRHNANLNVRNFNYGYRGNQWKTNFRHNFGNRQSNLNANYRRNHNFNVGHNWQNRQTNIGYRYNFGRRRRGIAAEQDYSIKIENNPIVFLEKLTLHVHQFVETHKANVPALSGLSVIPSTDLTSNVTVARELVCLVRKLQRLLPKSLGNFIVKMIKFHGPNFDIIDLGDFFTVDPVGEYEGQNTIDDDVFCDLSDKQYDQQQKPIDGGELLEIKKFVASLITVAMEYQQTLEE